MTERTFVMIKPDGVRKGLVDEIASRIERTGLKIAVRCHMRLNNELANGLYSVHRGKPFFDNLVKFVLSGDVVVMIVEGDRAISVMRELNGATDPAKAARGTIRGDYASGVTKNIIHASDSPENAKREISIFF